MKKIKLMLVAFMAMVGVSAFAAATPWATTTYKYTVEGKVVTITGFVTGYSTESMATVEIPNTLPNPADESKTVEVTAIASKAFEKNANIKKVVIKATKLAELNDAFSGCANLEEIDFTEATGLKTIAAGAFTGTKVKALDLSTTILTGTDNWFGTKLSKSGTYTADEAAEYNAKLDGAVSTKSIKTPADLIASDELNTYYPEIATTWALVAKDAENLGEKKLSVVKYNAVTGAELEAGDALTEKRVAAYNDNRSNMVGTSKGNEVYYTADEAKTYNAALKGAVKADDKYTNPAVTNATLASVKLPGTWTSIAEKSFLFCTALTSIDFGKVKVTTQTLGANAFVGTAIAELDFTDTQVKALPTGLLIDGADVKTNDKLTKVTLTKDITDLKANFANCTKLTAIDLTNITAWAEGEFAGSGLTKVTIPVAYATTDAFATIPANAFKNCTALEEVIFAPAETGKTRKFTSIGEGAFANTGIKAFVVPAELPYATENGVVANAFADCAKLTSFTYKPTIGSDAVKKAVSDNAFLGCTDGITFYTYKEYAEAYKKDGAIVPPMHTAFSYESAPESEGSTEAKELTAKQFKQTGKTSMYFVKYNSNKENIKIAKADAKVYAAWNDDADGSIIMQAFKPKSGYYHIAAGDNVLMISTNEKIPYETTSVDGASTINDAGAITAYGNGSSWLTNASATSGTNMLKYVSAEAGVKRSAIEAKLTGGFAGFSIYAWANTEAFTGWKKITSGTTFPQNTLYIFAKPAADGVRVIWLDENGNIEDETTAIQGIESVEEAGNGASYNLAGQKVNAAYKGVVIKDGKKYMMK